jgi:hypothetical protein
MTTAPAVSITDELLAELRRLAEAATQGSWRRDYGNDVSISESGDEAFWEWQEAGPAKFDGDTAQTRADANYVSAANPAAILSLLYHIDELKARHNGCRDMAGCMEMFRRDMIEAGITGESCPSMFMTEGVLGFVRKLKDEVEELRKQLEDSDQALKESRASEAVSQETIRDAERYRWLRNSASVSTDSEPVVVDSTPSDRECLFGEGLDNAIDAAIAKESP